MAEAGVGARHLLTCTGLEGALQRYIHTQLVSSVLTDYGSSGGKGSLPGCLLVGPPVGLCMTSFVAVWILTDSQSSWTT